MGKRDESVGRRPVEFCRGVISDVVVYCMSHGFVFLVDWLDLLPGHAF